MIAKRNKINLYFLLVLTVLFSACKDEFYTIDDTFYDGMQIVIKNPLVDGTLRIEQYNSDKILIEEATDHELIFDSKAFIYHAHTDSIVEIEDDGTIKPISIGTTKVDVTFRADKNLTTSFTIEVYKDYHGVDYLQAASSLSSVLVEKDFSVNLAPYIFVFPAHADNKELAFSLDEASKQYASITAEGVITGVLAGIATVHVVSVENLEAKLTFDIEVVNEIEIIDLILHPRLNGVTIGLGEKINLDPLITIMPSNVNEVNRYLSIDVIDGVGVVDFNYQTKLLTATGAGMATVMVTTKNGIFKEFTINVDPGIKDLTRAFWGIETSITYGTGLNYVVDGTTGKPEDMFDDDGNTFLSMVKPGKTISGSSAPAGVNNYFTVDMQTECKFNTMRWNHRGNNSYTYLRVWAVKLEGSNDAESWTTIAEKIELPNTYDANHANDTKRHDIPLGGEFDFRYIKVTMTNWSDNSGGATSGNTMQIGEFGLSRQ